MTKRREQQPVGRVNPSQRPDAVHAVRDIVRGITNSDVAAAGSVLTADGVGDYQYLVPAPVLPTYRQPFVLEGTSASAGQTSLDVAFGGGTPASAAGLGIPVPVDMETSTVAVAWFSDTDPGGDWTATLWRRTPGGSFAAVATFGFQTS